MKIKEKYISIPAHYDENIFGILKNSIEFQLAQNEIPVRFVINKSNDHTFHCEIGVIQYTSEEKVNTDINIFNFRKRKIETTNKFNVALLVPTGIGAEIGGHAGDATAIAKLVAESCDRLILHPNVVNASDINEIPNNALYVEGSILDRLLKGEVGLQEVRSNRVLVLIDDHPDKHFVEAAINSVSAARAIYGLDCPEVVCLNPPIRMFGEYAESGRATGRIDNILDCIKLLIKEKDKYDSVALASVIRVPQNYHIEYFDSNGKMINPWGGVEAMLTHTLSLLLNIPAAHSPMFESKKIENLEVGIVEPRMSAEAVSLSFLQCILKGLYRAPKIICDSSLFSNIDVMTVEDVSCLIIPDGCLGLPVFAALEQGIHVIAVKDNKNIMDNDLSRLPWRKDQFIQVENYLEASGVLNLLKAGVTLESVRRPITYTKVSKSMENSAFKSDSA